MNPAQLQKMMKQAQKLQSEMQNAQAELDRKEFTATSGGNCGAAALTTGLVNVVSYNANTATSGTVPSNSSVSLAGGTLTLATNSGNLVKTNFTFSCWNTAADGSGTTHAAGATTFTPSGDTTLYAQWTANALTVTYDSQLGSAITAGATITGGSISASPGTPSRTGYEFAGWFTAASGGALASFPLPSFCQGGRSALEVFDANYVNGRLCGGGGC